MGYCDVIQYNMPHIREEYFPNSSPKTKYGGGNLTFK